MRMNLWPAILRPWPWMVKILDTDREKYSSQAKIFQTRAPAATGACTAAVPGAGRGAWQLWPPSPTPAPTSPPASTLASTQVLCSKHQLFLLSMHFTPGQRLSQCKKKYPYSFSTYFTHVVHTNDDPLCQNLKLWGNFDFFTFLV